MDDLLLRQNIQVATELDRVILSVGRLDITLPYAAAFRIGQNLSLGARGAMRVCGEGNRQWRERSELDLYPTLPKISTEKRRTLTGKFDWSIRVQGEMVYLKTGNNEVGFHFEIALKLATWLRQAGKAAKLWAGDSGRSMHAAGNLTDAEQNYKRGHH